MSDPIVDPNAPPPVAPPPAVVIPKTKEEWASLAETDPKQWISLTQPRMDQATRKAREAEEKAAAAEAKAKNLEAELGTFKKPVVKIEDPNEPKPFSTENLPATKEQWDQLWLEDPSAAADLRDYKREHERILRDGQTKSQTEFATARKEAAKTIWDRHPDMYVREKDDQGNVKLDGQGKPVLKLDPNTNAPMLDLDSEKGKLFVDVYSEDPRGYDGAKFGPRLAMVEMERRLQERGNKSIEAAGVQPGQGKAAAPDQRGVLPAGVTPPVTVKVSFSSDEEKAHVEKAIQRGIWKSPEDYCAMRDGKNLGIVEEGRTPKFG